MSQTTHPYESCKHTDVEWEEWGDIYDQYQEAHGKCNECGMDMKCCYLGGERVGDWEPDPQ